MAHYLSEVTLQKLDSRREDFGPDFEVDEAQLLNADHRDPHRPLEAGGLGGYHDSLGLRYAHDVMGYLRCVAVTSKIDARGELHKVLWCGEQDGVLVVRDWSSGDPIINIERKARVFVFCLASVGTEFIWAGLSDGYIRVFEGATCALLDEVKAHCGAIHSILFVPAPSQGPASQAFGKGLVVTGSNDWTIGIWDSDTLQCLGRLNGHQNAVRTLASPFCANPMNPTGDGSPSRGAGCMLSPLLVSGGDDGVIRCWDLLAREEVMCDGGWPVLGHKKGVTAVLILPTSVCLTAGQDGVCNAYDLGSGRYIKEVERRPCAIFSMMHDEIMSHVWIGGMDGIVSLYDTSTLNRLTSLFAHSGTYVVGLKPLARTNVLKVWTVSGAGQVTELGFGDGAQEWFRNSRDVAAAGFDDAGMPLAPLSPVAQRQEQQLQEIDTLRNKTIDNFSTLDAYRQELRILEAKDEGRR